MIMLCSYFIMSSLVPTAVTFHKISAERVYYPQSLSVLHEVADIRVFMSSSPLTLAPEEFLQRVLADFLTQEALDTGDREKNWHKLNK